MRALILQFDREDGPEHVADRLDRQGIGWDVVHMYLPHPPISLDGYDLLIGLGGEMHANDSHRFPFLDEAGAVLRGALARHIPILGICLGGQLLARALGAQVTRSGTPEVGVIRVTLDRQADDPILRGLPSIIETLQFHEDTFDMPEGAMLLASSADCERQIVRCTDRAYALQFHPEISARTLSGWVEAVSDESNLAGNRSRTALIDEARAHEATVRSHADRLIDNFITFAAETVQSGQKGPNSSTRQAEWTAGQAAN